MARTLGSDGGKTQAAIREAAADLIARRGYEAMSMRDLAAEVGVQPAALYRYFPTKQDLLFTLMRDHMVELAASWHRACPANAGPVERLEAFVVHHIAFHLARRHQTHVSNLELRSLSPERRDEVLQLRNAYEGELRAALREGAATGDFTIEDVGLAAMAIIQMITGVIVWFRPEDRLSTAEIARSYLAMTMRLVGAKTHPGEDHVRRHAELRA